MRLKHIKLVGFKSFVDPTTATFPSNLCAVVGPNGCGKSNVIDAVRWVMGESSAKNLRGEAMTDVIFNGSGGRKPLAQCSVELVFDNSDHTITGEYAGYNEIAIKRLVTRDAISTYFLNGTKCRRRDITDIFLGTGLGPRSYSIIEQGMVSRLIEAKPDDLRVFIEEAAGISKYKERRRDTENRIKRTRENLERLTDIREELERQIQHLKRQAAAAEKYAEYKKEERKLKAQLHALRWQKLNVEASGKEQSIRDLEVKLEACVADQVALATRIEKLRNAYTDATDAFNQVQGRYYSAGADVSRIEQSIQLTQERLRQLEEDLAQTDQSLQESEQHLKEDQHKIQGWENEVAEVVPAQEQIREQEQGSSAALQSAEEMMTCWQQEWDEFNHAASGPRQQAEVQQSRLQHVERALTRLEERIQRLEQESKTLSDGSEEAGVSALRQKATEEANSVESSQADMTALATRIEFLREQNHHRADQLDNLKSELQSMLGRRASLEALQQAALGSAAGTRRWLESQSLQGKPRLVDGLQVKAGWEKAVEMVLGNYLQAVCVDELEQWTAQLTDFKQGELLLLDGHQVRPLEMSSELARYSLAQYLEKGDISTFASGVYAVETLVEALALRHKLAAHESVVTQDGLWLGLNWLRIVRDAHQESGVLERKRELEALVEKTGAHHQQIDQQTEVLRQAREELKALEVERETLRRTVEQHSRTHSETRSRLSGLEGRIEQITKRRESLLRELNEARDQQTHENAVQTEARTLLESAIEAMERDNAMRANLLQRRDTVRVTLDQARQRSRHDRDRSHELAMRHQSVQAQLGSIRESVERLKVQTERLSERREVLKTTLAETGHPLAGLKQELEQKLQQRLSVEHNLTEARKQLETIEHDLRAVEQQRHSVEQELQALRQRLENERLGVQESQVRRKTISEQLQEMKQDLDDVIATMPEGASEEAWTEELERMANRIHRLGPINLAAIDEHQTQSDRKIYLDAQNADLTEALETLENAIRKIDRETRTRFKETFDAINNGFQELFPKVFGGGHAYLEMTGNDLLETGVAIMARPPGKRNSTIHLLSGGEKAMTAIALVFSIFRLNPAPFCMLDEVDAPLDDANVGRYARLVQEMSDKVQFICITHNKITMEAANQLMGVTMHEPGVSRLVTVDINEAAELAAV
jgi:chromosome segregation protein